MKYALFIVCIMIGIGAAPSFAESGGPTHLNATYAFTGVRSCAVSSTPFANDASGAPTVQTGATTRLTSVDSGEFTFHPDGTGTLTGRGDELDITTTTAGASISDLIEFSVPFTYTIQPGGTLVVNLGSGTFTVIAGTGAGLTGTTSPRTDRFQLGQGATSFVSAPKAGLGQETVQFQLSSGGSVTQYRVCLRSGVRVRL